MSVPLLQRIERPVNKVVILRASRVGDYLCATPALRALRAALPGAEITLAAMPFVADLASRLPHLDRFVAFPGFPGMAEQFFHPRRALAFFARMQAEPFDLAVQMHGSGVHSNPAALMLGARHTAGFIRPGDRRGRLDAALEMPDRGHEIRRLLALTEFLGAPPLGEQMELPLWPEDDRVASRLLVGARPPYFGLHPSSRDPSKCWPAENFLRVASHLQGRNGGTIVWVGGAEEEPLCRALADRVGGPYVSLAGKTSLPVLAAVVRRLDLVVTNDSGPAHIAYALGTPTVTIFRSTDPEQWGPPKLACHRVLVETSRAVSAEDVLDAAEKAMLAHVT